MTRTDSATRTPTERRLDAINDLVTAQLGGETWDTVNYQVSDDQREAIAKEIESLSRLGRTDRWQRAIGTWAAMVRRAEDATHALTQWAIFAGFDA